MSSRRDFDAVVVGGGVIGRAVALQLADSGRTVGYLRPSSPPGASAAAGAMLGVLSEINPADSSEKFESDLTEKMSARRLYDAWLERLAANSRPRLTVSPGLFVVANPRGEGDAAQLRAIAQAAEDFGSKAEDVDPLEIKGLDPDPSARAFRAIFLQDEGVVDTELLLRALADSISGHAGVCEIEGRAVRVSLGAPRPRVSTDGGVDLQSDHLVLACGAEVNALDPGDDLGLPMILSGRGVSAVARAPFEIPIGVRTPNRGFACGLHVLPRGGGRIYLGSTNRLSTTPAFDSLPTADEIETVLAGCIRELNHRVRDAEVTGISIGHRPVCQDRLPLVGRTHDPRVLVATGTYRNGILLAPRIAEMVVEELETPGRYEGHAYSPRREMPVLPGLASLAGAAAPALAALISGGAALAPGRGHDLEHFLRAALAVFLEGEDQLLGAKIRRLVGRAQMEEVLPLVFDSVARS